MKITNINQLIEEANKIDSQSERLQFVMNYFLNTVQYDYAYLLIKGFIQETISNIMPFSYENNIADNPFKKGQITIPINGVPKTFNDSFCFTLNVEKGKSHILDQIYALSQNVDGNIETFYVELEELLIRELRTHIDNEDIIKENIQRIIASIKNQMSFGRIADGYYISNDIKYTLLSYMLDPNKYMPPIIENGLIKRGVCQHYANYLAELLPQIGINAKRVDGTSELNHAWVAAIVDGDLKSIDLTRAIFIRDNYKGIPSNQKSSDWLISSFEDSFKMQKTRTLTGVGLDENGKEIPLPYVMDGSNFDKEKIMELVMGKEETKEK